MKKSIKKILTLVFATVASVAVAATYLPVSVYAADISNYTISQPENPNSSLKNVVIIGTGGTIAGSGDKGKTTNYKAGVYDVK